MNSNLGPWGYLHLFNILEKKCELLLFRILEVDINKLLLSKQFF